MARKIKWYVTIYYFFKEFLSLQLTTATKISNFNLFFLKANYAPIVDITLSKGTLLAWLQRFRTKNSMLRQQNKTHPFLKSPTHFASINYLEIRTRPFWLSKHQHP